MFEAGREYRVVSLKESIGSREGKLVEREGPIFTLDVGGVLTIFHMATVAYVEVVDRAAEDARSNADTDAWIQAMS